MEYERSLFGRNTMRMVSTPGGVLPEALRLPEDLPEALRLPEDLPEALRLPEDPARSPEAARRPARSPEAARGPRAGLLPQHLRPSTS
ncbi:hypothetical protein CgunFtcFv8_010082 [Champsocephalus gunnari]|uniref:Uncharacterized protein n=1 Tax=Champsocephalus gunnari TaxID=52237 RepID=A0AAN8HUE9_CHAGU|nr:hypothetical protein CgunFtcFv8_010082 [Champsocephalus gunnari]